MLGGKSQKAGQGHALGRMGQMRRKPQVLAVRTTGTQAFTQGGHSHGLFTSFSYLEKEHILEPHKHFSQNLQEEIHFCIKSECLPTGNHQTF